MLDPRILIASIVAFVGGIVLFILGFIWLKQKKLIENIPTSKIRSLAMGLVEIYGAVVPAEGKILKSPFSNKDCVFYDYRIEEYRQSGKHSQWVTIRNGKDSVPFFLKDDTATVLVEPKEASLSIKQDLAFQSGMGKDPSLQIKKYLTSQGLKFETFFGMNKKMRFIESFIEPKDKLYIMGTADENPYSKGVSSKNHVENIMIQKGKNDKFYFISDTDEKDILGRFKWKVFGGLFGGSILSIAGLTIILLYFGFI